ncbi:MAG: DUF790 family protein [Chitinophagaceae bacterium]|nr:DUF790 family protein [Oligoflexus sp.]
MLTKDLLKYTVRSDKIFPKYIKPNDAETLLFARYLVESYRLGKGMKQEALTEKIKKHPKSGSAVFGGLNKLLEDRCSYAESEDVIEQTRWDYFKKAKALRNSGVMSVADFHRQVAEGSGLNFSTIEAQLYGDLPEFRIVQEFEDIDPEDLIHRYNASQIQGLILRSRSLIVTVRDKDAMKKRRLLQRLKFWRLLAEIEEEADQLKISLSGPLTLFDKSATYGSRLSNFFPNLLLMDRWELKAEIKIQEKILTLDIDSSKPIKSHYGSFKGYIPSEFKEFIHIFNSLSSDDRRGWVASEGEDVINLGQQSYSVPDISFRSVKGKTVHLELFHKWHETQLKQRVGALSNASGTDLILGVSTDLVDKEKLGEMVGKSKDVKGKIFTFKRFPTPKAIMAYLS